MCVDCISVIKNCIAADPQIIREADSEINNHCTSEVSSESKNLAVY